jgi:peptidoglycan-N-acetylglucosamine deacetylase
MHGRSTVDIEAVLMISPETCERALRRAIELHRDPRDASLPIRTPTLSVLPHRDGFSIDVDATCRAILTHGADQNSMPVIATTLAASRPDTHFATVLHKARRATSRPAHIMYRSRTWIITPQDLATLFDVSTQHDVPTLIIADELLRALAARIATHIGAVDPRLETCERYPTLRRIDLDALRTFLYSLSGNNDRTFELSMVHDGTAPLPIHRRGSGTIAITYDDGMTYADHIMDIAACYRIPVTFFEIGSRANRDASALRRAIQEGHAVESHGTEHAVYDYGTGHSYAWQLNDITTSIATLQRITGVRPKYFRPPGGNTTPTTRKAAADNGVQHILWNISSEDTNRISAAATCANVLAKARPNGVALLHSTLSESAHALPCIIEGLKDLGYELTLLP